MWSTDSIPKVKNFIWRATQITLPVMSELARRGIQIPLTCPFCEDIETVSHALFSCTWAKRAWFRGMGLRWNTSNGVQWEEWLKSMHDVGTTRGEHGYKQRIIGETMAWEIWKERCQALNSGENPKSEAIIRVATSLAEETWRARLLNAEFGDARRSDQHIHA